jgi:ferritin-like metal-binding protein YciE
MKVTSSNDLLWDQLRDLHSVESQLTAELPRLYRKTTHPELRMALEEHASETERQAARLKEIFEWNGVEIGSDKCKAMAGLIKGGRAHLKAVENPHVRDLMMIAHCLRIEQYEIAAYEITRSLAAKTGSARIAEVLDQLLAEEKRARDRCWELEPMVFELATQAAKE